jgi:diaminohydroxyphosphoribosylaminopyrimidine deaminase/5-amino-6-(5-phosphoribosylamino)uracil reductase
MNTIFMQRCFDLARMGAGSVSPNPMVGAVIVHQNRIIGEGYYKQDGGPHAEVMAVQSVKTTNRHLLSQSTIYISLEPCNIYGRTPPCTDLLLEAGIPHVVVASSDLTKGVDGSGLARLREKGVKVEEGVLGQQGEILSAYRNIYVSQQRPYVMLKYAQSANHFIAPQPARNFWLTNAFSQRLVHKWRTETDAILIGSGTARIDNPALTARYFPGKQPLRIVLDRHGRLSKSLQLFDGQHPSLIYSMKPGQDLPNVRYVYHDFTTEGWLSGLLKKIALERIAHLTVEGGAWLLQQFVDQQSWDEARVFTTTHSWTEGLSAPLLPQAPNGTFHLLNDRLDVYYR